MTRSWVSSLSYSRERWPRMDKRHEIDYTIRECKVMVRGSNRPGYEMKATTIIDGVPYVQQARL
jgi:hypothetical protein